MRSKRKKEKRRETIRHGISKRRRNPRSGRSPSKTKKGRRERQVKKLLLVAFVVSGLAFVPCSVRTLRSKLEFRELGLDRASTTAIPISNTGIIPAGGITTSNPTMGTTEDRHTIRITGIECIPVTTVIICIKPRWAQSARFDEIVFACLCLNVAAKS